MLLRLFYLYRNLPKKSAQLAEIVTELENVYVLPKGGSTPVHCQDTRWITHKRRAMQRIVYCYGFYITHLEALINDSSVKPVDKSKLSGYHKRWSRADMLVGCALNIELLKTPSLLSFSLQDDVVDIVQGIKNILKSISSLQALIKGTPKEWPTVKLVFSRIGSDNTYQGASLTQFSETAISRCCDQAKEDAKTLDTDLKLLRSLLLFIDARYWATSLADAFSEMEEPGVLNITCRCLVTMVVV